LDFGDFQLGFRAQTIFRERRLLAVANAGVRKNGFAIPPGGIQGSIRRYRVLQGRHKTFVIR
jgi:hypothetical protein